jgi:putative ABC transport system ATP-binding protein
VTRRYQRAGQVPVTALDHVDLSIEPGEFVAVQGPSGSGKTTLLGLLAGLELPDDGTVRILGHEASRLTVAERARLRRAKLGVVFQAFGLVPSLDVLGNVALPLTLGDTPARDRDISARRALAEVGLEDRGRARIDELSGGQRQRVGIARALVADPAVVLADEPTGSLDDETAVGVLALLSRAVRERGSTLVLVTHDPQSAALADRQLWLRDGRIAGSA